MVISVVCNSRAEAGPLESVIEALKPDVCVTKYDAEGLTPACAMSQALPYFTAMFQHQSPEMVVVLGDRYETLAAALAAKFMRLPIAHIHGGETTTGSFDNAFRHSISHLADLHLVPTDTAEDRVDSLLDGSDDIHIVGAPGLDGIKQNSAKRDQDLILVTYHPETMEKYRGSIMCRDMLVALDELLMHSKYEAIFTGVNADPGAIKIGGMIEEFVQKHPLNSKLDPNLTHQEYIHLMQQAALVVGNSSAGIIETPWIGIPSVNLGHRQSGRPMARSVFGLGEGKAKEILNTIKYALSFEGDPEPEYVGGAAPKIAEQIRKFLRD